MASCGTRRIAKFRGGEMVTSYWNRDDKLGMIEQIEYEDHGMHGGFWKYKVVHPEFGVRWINEITLEEANGRRDANGNIIN